MREDAEVRLEIRIVYLIAAGMTVQPLPDSGNRRIQPLSELWKFPGRSGGTFSFINSIAQTIKVRKDSRQPGSELIEIPARMIGPPGISASPFPHVRSDRQIQSACKTKINIVR